MIAGALEIQMLANLARLRKDMSEAKTVVGSAMQGVSRAVGIAKSALIGLGLGIGAIGFTRMIGASIDAQDNLAKLAQKINISVESLVGWQHAVELSGGNLESFSKGVKTLGTLMFDSKRGTKEAIDTFAELGIKVTDAKGNLKSTETVILEIADRFSKLKDSTEKSALAVKAFGKAGLDMIPLLNQGSDAIRQMRIEGEFLNPVTSMSAAQAEVFNDNITRLKLSVNGLITRFTIGFLPGLAEVSAAMVEAAKDSGILAAAWVGLGGVAAATLGQLDSQKINKRLGEIGSAIEKAREQLSTGSLKTKGTEDSPFLLFGLSPTLSAAQKDAIKKNIDALESERVRLLKQLEPKKPKDLPDVDLIIANAERDAAAKKALAEKEKLRQQDIKGWVTYAETILAEDEDLAAQLRVIDQAAMDQREADRATELKQVLGEIDAEQDREIARGAVTLANSQKVTDEMTEFWRAAAESMQRSMSDLFFDAMQGDLRDLGANFKKTMDRLVADALAAAAATKLFGKDFGKGGDIGGIIGKGFDFLQNSGIFGGVRAGGGPVVGGKGYLIGEKGPEMFFPSVSGTVTPNASSTASNMNVTNVFHVSGSIDRRSQMQIATAAGEGVQRAMMRNT